MELALQWVGGVFYTLNKIFLFFSEQAKTQGNGKNFQRLRVISWVVYLIGLPAWVILLAGKKAWIAAALEAGGGPAMLLGLITAIRGTAKDPPRWLDRLAVLCIPVGLAYSIYDFGGLNTIGQGLELGLVLGFLVGTYQLARERRDGYLWYLLMHIATSWLMLLQGYFWLFCQQVLSLVLIFIAYQTARRKEISGEKESNFG